MLQRCDVCLTLTAGTIAVGEDRTKVCIACLRRIDPPLAEAVDARLVINASDVRGKP